MFRPCNICVDKTSCDVRHFNYALSGKLSSCFKIDENSKSQDMKKIKHRLSIGIVPDITMETLLNNTDGLSLYNVYRIMYPGVMVLFNGIITTYANRTVKRQIDAKNNIQSTLHESDMYFTDTTYYNFHESKKNMVSSYIISELLNFIEEDIDILRSITTYIISIPPENVRYNGIDGRHLMSEHDLIGFVFSFILHQIQGDYNTSRRDSEINKARISFGVLEGIITLLDQKYNTRDISSNNYSVLRKIVGVLNRGVLKSLTADDTSVPQLIESIDILTAKELEYKDDVLFERVLSILNKRNSVDAKLKRIEDKEGKIDKELIPLYKEFLRWYPNADSVNSAIVMLGVASSIRASAVNMIPNFKAESDDGEYIFRRIEYTDPVCFTLGMHTNCCQHIDGGGKSCVTFGVIQPISGFYGIYKKSIDRYIAQSWVWYDDTTDTLIIDSVEALSGYDDIIIDLYYKALNKSDDIYRPATIALGATSRVDYNMFVDRFYEYTAKTDIAFIECFKLVNRANNVYNTIQIEPYYNRVFGENPDTYTDTGVECVILPRG